MSVPYFGKQFTFTQPDGIPLQVVGYGDQHFAVFQTLDGYTVVEDPATHFYHHASLSPDGTDLMPLGVIAGRAPVAALGLEPGLRPTAETARAKAYTIPGLPVGRNRWRQRYEEAQRARLAPPASPGAGLLPAPPQRTTTGDFVGLCLLVQFPDVAGTITREEVEAFCNQPGYAGFGNHGSVYDYFLDNSGGRLRYRNIVVDYYTAQHPRAYYTDESVEQPLRAWELIKEALAALKAKGFDFTQLTVDQKQYCYALNVYYAGPCVNNWAKGLWPHSHHLQTRVQLADDVFAYDYQFTDMGRELTLGTFCHENGHMVCDFPDLYDYGYESSGVGAYCLMCAGGIPDPKNPANIGAYLKYRAGWAAEVTPIGPETADGAVARASGNEFFIHERSRSEYYILENRLKTGRDASLPCSGLAIWRVDEAGSNNDEQMTPVRHYECSLVQADGRFDLEKRPNWLGDKRDLFGAPNPDHWTPDTKPDTSWWDGKRSGLAIRDVSAPGNEIRFKGLVQPT
jgi:M6 family metalloprotease-like protein